MKLIIDIDEETYKNVKNFYDNLGECEVIGEYECAIAEGIPLEAIKTDVHRHKMDFYPSDYTLINTLIDKWINRGVDI